MNHWAICITLPLCSLWCKMLLILEWCSSLKLSQFLANTSSPPLLYFLSLNLSKHKKHKNCCGLKWDVILLFDCRKITQFTRKSSTFALSPPFWRCQLKYKWRSRNNLATQLEWIQVVKALIYCFYIDKNGSFVQAKFGPQRTSQNGDVHRSIELIGSIDDGTRLLGRN